MAAPPRVVLVDGTAMIYRAYYAIPSNLRTSGGLPTNAIFGFATMFRKLLSGRKPELGAVVFDAPGKTFRDEQYSEYKANRVAMDDALGEQLPWIDRLVQAHNFPILRVPGYEADDVIGTLTRQALEQGMEVWIVSGDKDFAQLIGERVRMLDAIRDVTFDPELVRKKWGVPPAQFVDYLALVGDQIDNIPGVPGIGPKGAVSLLEAHGSLDGILAALPTLKGRAKTALEQHRQSALESRSLATIHQHVPLDRDVASLTLELPAPEALNGLYKELEFYSLLSEEARTEVEADGSAEVRVPGTLEELEGWLAALEARPLAIATFFEAPSAVLGDLVGVAVAAGAAAPIYVPIAAPMGGLGGRLTGGLGDAALAALRPLLEDPAVAKVAHDAKASWIALARVGVRLAGVTGDTQLASFLIDPTKLIPHRLDQLTKEYLHRTVPPLKRVVGSGQAERRLAEVDAAELGAHAGLEVKAVAELWSVLAERLETEGQAELLGALELPLAFVLGGMERHGIAVDAEELAVVQRELEGQLAALEAEIHRIAGRSFNIGSTKQLAQVLFEELKLPVVKRTKTGYSTDSEVLERLAPKHEIARHLLEHRKLAKLISTYTSVLQSSVSPATGRIHATFQQTTSATGRLISTDPDLQRTPIKTPEGRRIRRAFVAPPGTRLISADWSQIELRILAHVSQDPLLLEAFAQQIDVHRRTASQLFGVPFEEVTSAQRGVGKTVNFATIYGQGATALGQILGVPRKEAERYIQSYFQAYAGVRRWLDETIATATEAGFVTTLFGRRRYIHELYSNNVMEQQAGQRIAANTPIQGSAADLCKLAMLQIARALEAEGLQTKMVLQVHDELVFEAPEDEVERASALVRRHMETVHPLSVPLVVELGVGASWGEAH